MNNEKVAICMATYNGEKYISEQINSILNQTYQNFVIYIRDDGSTDNTMSVIESMASGDERIKIIRDNLKLRSAHKNFAEVLKIATESDEFEYFMFCDQDDFWLENKIELCIERIRKCIAEYGRNIPILVHTDLMVVDSKLTVLSESFMKYRALDAYETRLNRLLVQNNVTGCTMMWNKSLNGIINLSDERVVMHDWWMTIVASLTGKIIFIDKPTIKYRQHENNVVGATKVKSLKFILNRLLMSNKIKETFKLSVSQAEGILNIYKDKLSSDEIKILSIYASLYNYNKIKRLNIVFKNKFFKQGKIQIIGELLFI